MIKFRFWTFFLIFLVFLTAGYTIPSVIDRLLLKSSASLPEDQINIVLIHVDNLDQNSPSLISVWGVIADINSGSPILLKPLYPSFSPTHSSDLLNSTFAVSSRGKIAHQFMHQLNKLDVDWLGYIMLDDQAAVALSQSVTTKTNNPTASYRKLIDPRTRLFLDEQQLAFDLCSLAAPVDSQQEILAILTTLSPDHVRTNLSNAIFLQGLESTAGWYVSPHCEILADVQ
jgi:hypothetical protein